MSLEYNFSQCALIIAKQSVNLVDTWNYIRHCLDDTV